MRTALVLGLLVVAGCSSKTVVQGPCAQRSGTYVVDLTSRSGNCGAQAETVVNGATEPKTVSPPCSGTIGYSADNCRVTNDETCPNSAQAGAVSNIHAEYDWSQDGSSATGIFALDVEDSRGVQLCQGTYDVNIARR